jgi:hypothetical protein
MTQIQKLKELFAELEEVHGMIKDVERLANLLAEGAPSHILIQVKGAVIPNGYDEESYLSVGAALRRQIFGLKEEPRYRSENIDYDMPDHVALQVLGVLIANHKENEKRIINELKQLGVKL